MLTELHPGYWCIISLANFNGTGQICCCFVIINPTPSPLDRFFLETGEGVHIFEIIIDIVFEAWIFSAWLKIGSSARKRKIDAIV